MPPTAVVDESHPNVNLHEVAAEADAWQRRACRQSGVAGLRHAEEHLMRAPVSAPQSVPVEPAAPGPVRGGRRRVLGALAALVLLGAGGALAMHQLTSPPADPRAASAVSGDSVPAGGVASGGSSPAGAGAPSGAGGPGGSPASAPASAASGPAAGAASGASWTTWRPQGRGSLTTFALPAPWTGGVVRQVKVVVYLPAGYATSTRAYPVVYEAPFSFNLFENWIGLQAILDAKIASGALPASLYVFVQPAHSPIHDTECADSVDGRQKVDTFVSSTLVQTVDQRFRTIPTAAARAVMGFSQGGFCAAMLALQHPDVFATAISISGYYEAGIRSGQTPVAWMPFGGLAAAEAAASPVRLVTRLTPAQRQTTLLVLEADPAQPFYGPQYTAMLAAAHRAGVAVVAVPMQAPHSWPVVAASLPMMLAALAQHEARLHVFG